MQEPPTEPIPADRRPMSLIGSTIGRYRVLSQIGRGGQGEVYLAEDPRLFRKVALKKLPPELAQNKSARRSAISEAIRASRLSDPHVAEVFDVVEEDDEITLVMEYVEGRMLREQMIGGISLDEFWDVGIQCVEAVEAAHRGGLLHRDIKPENIMITPQGQVKILDFGIAKRLPRPEEMASMTTQTYTPNVVWGTPPYMSPEAHLNESLDERSDLFSLGVVFYEMLTGRRPFQGNLAEIIDGILRCKPPPPSTVGVGIPESLDHVVLKLLARDRRQRYGSASELLNDMVAAHRGDLVMQTPTGIEPTHHRWPWILGSVVAALVVISAVVPDFRFQWKRTLGMSVLPDRVSAAVLPFEVMDGDADIAAFSIGLTRVVTDRLNRLGAAAGVYVAPASEPKRYGVASPEKARAELGVTVALRTRIRLSGTELIGRLELVDAKEQRILAQDVIREAWTHPVGFADLLSSQAAHMLEVGNGIPGEPRLSPEIETTEGTFRFYLEGLGKLEAAGDSASVAAAMIDFQRAVSIAPEYAVAWVEMARARLVMFEETGEASWLKEAETAALQALALDETLPVAHYLEGQILSEENQWELAAAEYQTVIDQDPMYRDAYYGLAEAYEMLGFPENAEAVHESAISALPNDYHCYWYLGYFHLQQGQDDKALDAFRRMTLAAPDLSRGYAYYGGLLVQVGEYRRAVEALDRSIHLKPIDSAFTNLGIAHFQLRDFDSAIRAYREAIGFGYANYRLWYNLGDAYYWAPGKRHLAKASYSKGIELAREKLVEDPEDYDVLAEMADMFPKVGQPDSAKIYMERCLEKVPDNPYFQYWAALVAWQLGEREKALDWLEQAVANGYSKPWIKDSPIFDTWRPLERFQAILTMDVGE